MTFKINRKSLLNALALGASRSNISKVLQAYTNILLEIKTNGFLYISSCDGDNSITTKVKVDEFDEVVKVMIEPKITQSILKTLQDENIVFAVNGSVCEILHEKGKFEIPVLDANEYPILQNALEGENVKISSDLLMDYVNDARLFTSNDDLRPALCGIYISVRDGVISVSSSDGHKLFTDSASIDSTLNFDFILANTACGTLLQLCNESENIIIYNHNNVVTFRSDTSMYSCRKIEARYPNIQSVIPHDCPIKVNAIKNDIASAIKRSILTSSTSSNLICLDIKGNNISIESKNLDFSTSSQENCYCTHSGGDIKIGVKGSYLDMVLSTLKSDDIPFELTSSNRAIVIKDNLHPKRVLLLMPLMLD